MTLLARDGVSTTDLATRMRQAVGFRNVLVHEYVDVDDGRPRSPGDPVDLEQYVSAVNCYFEDRGDA